MNSAIEKFEDAVTATPPETYYDLGKKEYLIRDAAGEWFGLPESPYKRVLKSCGISAKVDSGKHLSAQDEAILSIQQARNVHFAGPLAGYQTGFHRIGTTRVLVTSSPKIIEPVAGDWACLKALIDGLLGVDGGIQVPFFHGWVKVAYEALRADRWRPGQVLVFAGQHGSGKSLLQKLLTEILGGRAAKPYQCMSGGTSFNSDLFGAEHLVLEDESPSFDLRARRAFGAQIKNVAVNEVQRLHGKFREALILSPFWRMTVSINDEEENIQVLPPLDDSLEDKLIILKARRAEMPMPSETLEQRQAFWGRLVADLPGFLEWLTRWEIPADLRCQRFGVKHFHHPEIVGILDTLAPEARLLSLIDGALLPEPTGNMLGVVNAHEQYEGTAEQIEQSLTAPGSSCAFEARKLLSWNNACGTYLGRLAKKRPDRVQPARRAEARCWRILRPRPVVEEERMTA